MSPNIKDFSNELSVHINDQNTGTSASALILPVSIQGFFTLRSTGLISLLSKGLSGVFSSTTVQKHLLWHSAYFMVQLSHPYMTTGKTIALTRRTFLGKVMSLLLNMLSRLVITFLPRSKRLLISWLQSPSAVILEPKKIKSDTVSTVSPSISHEVMGPDAMIFIFWMLSFKPTFSLVTLQSSKQYFHHHYVIPFLPHFWDNKSQGLGMRDFNFIPILNFLHKSDCFHTKQTTIACTDTSRELFTP